MANILVAKSYQNLTIEGEPYKVNGKTYVQVRMKNGSLKQVKVYTATEYKKYYGEEAPISDSKFDFDKTSPYHKSQKETLGFGEKGYITIFRGDTFAYKDWFKENGAVYRKWWGWSFAENQEIPELPFGIESLKLEWNAVGMNNEELKSDEDVKKAVETIIYADLDAGAFVGEVGERLTFEATVNRITQVEGFYGTSLLIVLKDANGNTFCWFTTANVDWEEGEVFTIRGTVKKQEVYKGVNTTYLSRCKKVNK